LDYKKFREIFRGLDRAYGVYYKGETKENGKLSGKAYIKKEPLEEIYYKYHLEGQDPSLGVVPIMDDSNCFWGCCDIDKYPLDFKAIIKKLKLKKIPMSVCRSKSGGAHLFLFTKQAVSATIMRNKLYEIAAYLGYADCEIFPKQTEIKADRGDTGNFLNLPYHGGDESMRYAMNDEGQSLSVEEFYKHYDDVVLTPKQLKEISVADESRELKDGPPCLETLMAEGFPEGTRDNALYQYAVYAKKAFPDHWQDKIAEFNHKYMDPSLSIAQVNKTIKQHEKKEYAYKCKDQPMCSHCNSNLCRQRIHGVGPDYEHKFGDLTKYQSDESVWFLNVDGQRLELTTDQLFDQSKFRKACMDNLNVLPNPMNTRDWTARIQQLLQGVEIIEMPKEVRKEGRFEQHLDNFINDQGKAMNIEEILIGKAWAEEGKIFFKMSSLEEYLQKKRFTEFTTTQMGARIKQIGGGDTRKRVRGKVVYMWFVPDQSGDDVNLDLPSMKEELPF
jgi:hypothetical protein|tara:strand:- start:831 stop:2333 length:1503 start_codon:yes stop_codon:yes gene_type:complete